MPDTDNSDLRAEYDRHLSERDIRYQQQLESVRQAGGLLRGVLEARLDALEQGISERSKRYQERHDALVTLVRAEFAATEKAVLKAETASERRFESVNEFRNALSDQTARLLTRAEADARFNAVGDQSAEIRNSGTKLELEVRGISSEMIRRIDVLKIENDIDKIREINASSAGKTLALSQVATFSLAVFAILVSLGGVLWSGTSHPPTAISQVTHPPLLGSIVDTNSKRLDDMLAQNNEQNRLLSSRLDALSARINQIQPRQQ